MVRIKLYGKLIGSVGVQPNNKIIKTKNIDVFLPPANEVCEGYVFTRVCHSVHKGHAWQGACMRECMAAGGGYAWWGVCVAGGMHGGGYVWQGDMQGSGEGGCMAGGHTCHGRNYGIRSMSGCYASYWNAFLSRPLYMSTWMSHK